MGCVFSFISSLIFDNVDDAKAVSKKIDKQILQELKNEPDEIEILILGAQEAGKSTLLKQIRLIHKSDYTLEERLMFKPIVFANTIQSMSIILHAVERLGNNDFITLVRGQASEASGAPSYSALVRCNWGKIVKMGASEASH